MPSTELVVANSRAIELTNTVKSLKSKLVDNLLHLGELLSEARLNDYPQELGFDSFAEWLEDTGLDMSERQAYYLIKIVDNARSLGIPREQLQQSKMSKLKEIFALDPATQGEQIKQLVAASADMKLKEVRAKVAEARGTAGLEPTTWRNFRVTESQAQVIDFSLANARMDYGQFVDENTGEVTEATDGTLLADVICQGYKDNRDREQSERNQQEYGTVIDVGV